MPLSPKNLGNFVCSRSEKIYIYIYIYKYRLIYSVLFINLVFSVSYPGALHTWGSDTKVL